MKVLKRDERMLLITLIIFLLASSSSSMVRQDFAVFGVEREEVLTGGTNLKQKKVQQTHLPLFQIKRRIPTGPNPLHNFRASPPSPSKF
ncbi:hypothetical protein CARUB_v10021277mg [Capsella rubella]|uniref:Uncharacterized protein n=1 Tax=Capsella rubella TaxID=81985 RepID=R0GDU7_9BRAS|nr:CLAVATA3/ESR (CLE)-related protein 8 [Capsella rubella]EOA33806.1 hypothetical protein CARUB_v10021277mg [Capsella rubella]